jgi:hypothetical protein
MSDIQAKLRCDLEGARTELVAIEEHRKMLIFQIQYIESLLGVTEPSGAKSKVLTNTQMLTVKLKLKHGMTIADVAELVLDVHNQPLSAMDIERIRSHFSAVISKDLKAQSTRFWQIGRGKIGLAKLGKLPTSVGGRLTSVPPDSSEAIEERVKLTDRELDEIRERSQRDD